MFNLIDVILIGVVALAGFVGYKAGFVKTVISFLSFFIAIALAFAFYNPLAVILTEQTEIDDWIENKIINYGISGDQMTSGDTVVQVKAETDIEEKKDVREVLSSLPSFVSESLDIDGVKTNIKHEIAKKTSELIMKVLSLIMIYVVVKVTLLIASILLGGVMKLPALKQLNEILGMSLGAVIGFANMYVVFAIFTLISSITNIDFVIDAIKSSLLASVMFENNIIIRFLFQ